MNKLYAPWREGYITDDMPKKKNSSCVFCDAVASVDDERHFVLKRYEHTLVLLNIYPYNAGHLMIIPQKHVADITDLSKVERNELIYVLGESMHVLRKVLKPDGINSGINSGTAAGASIIEHLHVHVVPRWAGDTNFMPVIAQTKHISFDLTRIYREIKKAFDCP